MGEWVSDSCLKPIQQFFSYIMLIFNAMMMRPALFQTNTLSWIFIVLAHWNNSLQVIMSLHSGTLFWFQGNQFVCSFSLMLRAYRRSNKYQFYSLWFYLTRTRTYDFCNRCKHTNHDATDAVMDLKCLQTKELQVREVTHIIDSGQENKTDADLSEDSFHSMYWHFELKIYEKSTNITLVSLYSKYNRGLHKRMGVVCLLQQYLSCIVVISFIGGGNQSIVHV